MKEYRVEMLVNGEWRPGRTPNHGSDRRTFATAEKASEQMAIVQKLWTEHRKRCERFINNYPDKKVEWDRMPTDYRIAAREVTEWEAL